MDAVVAAAGGGRGRDELQPKVLGRLQKSRRLSASCAARGRWRRGRTRAAQAAAGRAFSMSGQASAASSDDTFDWPLRDARPVSLPARVGAGPVQASGRGSGADGSQAGRTACWAR